MWLYIDFETRSRVPIAAGTDRYMTGAEPIIATWAIDNGPVRLWDMLAEPRQPKEFTSAIYNAAVIYVAHNAAFDRAVMARLLLHDTPASRWVCTRAQAYAHSLPGALDYLGEVLNISDDTAKITDGKRLIQLFCVPKKDGTYRTPQEYPDEWEKFKNYAMRDIDALRAIHRRLPTSNFTGANLRYYWLNSRVNERGFAIDLPLVEAASKLLASAKARSDESVGQATGGQVTAVTQRDRLLKYLQSTGLDVSNLRKSELEARLQEDTLSPEQRFLIEARLEGAKASGAKYKKALAQHVGERLRYTMQFSGAGATGRTAHKGFQPGNMPRTRAKARWIDEYVIPAILSGGADLLGPYTLATGGAHSACGDALRHCIKAEPGNELVVADFSNIESRVLAWIAGELWKLAAFIATDRGEAADTYRLLYARFFGADVTNITDFQRQIGKVIELACGFGGAVGAFVSMAAVYGVDLDTLPALVLPNASPAMLKKAENAWKRAFMGAADFNLEPPVFQACHVLVQLYRAANTNIDALKKNLGHAVEAAIRQPGAMYEVGKCKLWCQPGAVGPFIIQLPSGRRLNYWYPEIQNETVIDPETGDEEDRFYVSYKRPRGKMMLRERAWAGLFLENIVQAIGNDCLRYAELDIDQLWPDSIVLDVHDEVVTETPCGTISLDDLTGTMCKGWPWSAGLPLAAAGWVGPRYGKRG